MEIGSAHWLTPAETATFLGLTRNTVYQLIRRREIPAGKIGGRQFVDTAALLRLMRNDLPSGHLTEDLVASRST